MSSFGAIFLPRFSCARKWEHIFITALVIEQNAPEENVLVGHFNPINYWIRQRVTGTSPQENCVMYLLNISMIFLVGACARQPFTARLVLRPIIHCYTVRGMLQWDWQWVINIAWNLLAPLFYGGWFRYGLGLLGVDMHCGFTRPIGISTGFHIHPCAALTAG